METVLKINKRRPSTVSTNSWAVRMQNLLRPSLPVAKQWVLTLIDLGCGGLQYILTISPKRIWILHDFLHLGHYREQTFSFLAKRLRYKSLLLSTRSGEGFPLQQKENQSELRISKWSYQLTQQVSQKWWHLEVELTLKRQRGCWEGPERAQRWLLWCLRVKAFL